MSNMENLQLFEDQPIRAAWNEEEEEWYFSIVDVVWVLTDQPDARHASTYWAVLKKRLIEEGASELLTNCKQLKLRASDGKRRLTDVANTEQLLRILSICCLRFCDSKPQTIPKSTVILPYRKTHIKRRSVLLKITFCSIGSRYSNLLIIFQQHFS